MMAQPQSAQGCAVCGAPFDPLDETREPAKRAVCRGRRPLVTLGLSKVTRPSPKGGRNPFEGKALAQTKTAALGLRFFYWLNLLAPDANKANRP
ncbi:hypothetical protein CF123_06655 [Aeromonas veronii]|uniref:Uncharacterized protein n=1 Tax=Aeromonas veronii TaxID=654 RepID=A0AAX2UXA7_AERVE|nr:hypothetical protein CF123_06655 [Aeromonas veronii]